MHILSVSLIFFILIQMSIFSSPWFAPSIVNNIILISFHFVITLIASYSLSRIEGKTGARLSLKQKNINGFLWFNLLFFIPIIGAIILWLFSIRKTLRREHIESDLEEEEEANTNKNVHYFSAPKQHHSNDQKQTRDLISTLDDDTYLKLLVASRHLPDKEAYTLLKEALNSPFESARLMAFSLKGSLEERLQKELQQKLSQLKQASESDNIAELHLTITKDYIHLLDIGLLSESNDALLKKAKKHCINAIHIDNKSAYAFQALSKILRYQGRNKQAQRAQIKAVNLGLPLERLYST